MKRLLMPILIHGSFLFQTILLTINCYSQPIVELSQQKKNLELIDIKSWATLGFFSDISKNGAYFLYEIVNQPVGNSTLVIRSTKGDWERRILGIRLGFGKTFFSNDSKQFVYQKEDSLFVLTLGSSLIDDKIITNVNNFSIAGADAGNWLVYRSKSPKDKTTIYYLNSQKELVLPSNKAFWFDKIGTSLLIKTEVDSSGGKVRTLEYFDINNQSINRIWTDTLDFGDVTFSKDGLELAFTVYKPLTSSDGESIKNQMEKEIWYFKKGMITAVLKVNSDLLHNDFNISGKPMFAENSNWLIFDLQKKTSVSLAEKGAINVKIWSYKDKIILPDQIRINNSNKGQRNFKAAINLITNQFVPIENESDFFSFGLIGDYVVIKGENFIDEAWWKIDHPHPTILLSLKNGKRIILKKDNTSLSDFSSSPDGNWLIYYDNKIRSFFSCNLKTGKIINITKSIPTSFQNEFAREGSGNAVFGVVAWVLEDNSLILYDNYDIWRIDPSGLKKAINITNGYGKKNNLKLRIVYSNEVHFGIKKNLISSSDTLLIVAFSNINKYNGFFRKILNVNGNPQKLFMGPYTFYRTESQKPHFWSLSDGMQPQKADSADIWIVTRETSNESKNYFVTEDFKEFRPMSNLYPEKEYNWLTTELVNWKQLDGTMSQGILYKPENFDSTKKYPLLITYYEKLSHRLFEFPTPEYSNGDINIPWFVTHGYLVFTPDIHYKIASTSGKTTGEWAFNTVVSAAQYLSKVSYVDKTKIGIEGHSFGGGQTNFIITHTNLFAAACEFAGDSDPISGYLTLVPGVAPFEHFSKQTITESGQGRKAATLWERPELYIKESTVLRADKIITPLLIIHNEKDNNISWRQGIELYMALRRLGRKVWMLQFDDGHSLHLEKNAIDFTIRLTQFFDHYLKNAPIPNWIDKGISIDLIGIRARYQLNPAGNCGPDCKICKMWNEKWKNNSAAMKVEVRKWQKF